MVRLVHITAENLSKKISRNGLTPTKLSLFEADGFDRAVFAYPILPSYTLTYSWSRELKRWGATSLIAVTFKIADDEPVYARHYAKPPNLVGASEAVQIIRSQEDPRGYEILVPRRIAPREIVKIRILPKAIGWRFWPQSKGAKLPLCDCPVCVPKGEVKANKFRNRMRARMNAAGIPTEGSG